MRTTLSHRLVAAVAGAAIAVSVPVLVCQSDAGTVGRPAGDPELQKPVARETTAQGTVAQETVAQEAVDAATQAATVRYWTSARMVAALQAANGGRSTAEQPVYRARRLVKDTPPAVPAAPGPRPPGDTAGDGLAWTHGGAVTAAVGKIFFTLADEDYVCSGTLVGGKRADVVLTAAHCVSGGLSQVSAAHPATRPGKAGPSGTGLSNTGPSNAVPSNTGSPNAVPSNTGLPNTGQWATNWIFVPGFRDGLDPYGEYTARRFFVIPEWTGPEGGTEQYDVAFVQVTAATRYGASGAAEPPGLTVEFAARPESAAFSQAFVFGYPAEPPYSGLNLSYCAGPSAASGGSVRTPCGMTAGDSGGPWLAGFGPRSGTIVAVSTYKVSGNLRVLYGAVLGPQARAIYEQAVSSAR